MSNLADLYLHTAMIYFALTLTLCWSTHGLSFDMVVAKDGTGNFQTISEAIVAAPSHRSETFYIRIKAGIYPEYVGIGKEKTNIALIGDGVENTVITGDRSTNGVYTTSQTATVDIQGQGFIGIGLTIQNTAGHYKDQAVALMVEAEHSTFFQCRFEGYQDTLYTRFGTQFFRDCEVYGTVDFIFGSAAALFQRCSIYARIPRGSQSNTITAHKGMYPDRNTGIVLQNCTIRAAPELEKQHGSGIHTYLGRPWDSFATTVVMNSYLSEAIDPSGWLAWDGRDLTKVNYAEYHNQGPGANGRRVSWATTLTRPGEATRFTARNFLHGEDWIPSRGVPFFLDL